MVRDISGTLIIKIIDFALAHPQIIHIDIKQLIGNAFEKFPDMSRNDLIEYEQFMCWFVPVTLSHL